MRKRFIILLVAVALLFVGNELKRQAVASEGSGHEVFDVAPATDGQEEFIESMSSGWVYVDSMTYLRDKLAATTGLDGTIYAMGGMPNPSYSTDAFEAYDPETDTWSTKSPMPIPRNTLAAATGPDGKIYAIGGFINTTPYGLTNRVDVYDPATDSWSSGNPMPTARDWPGAAVVDGKIYVIGGGRSSSNGRRVEMYDPATDTWTGMSPKPSSRYAMGVAVADGKIYTIGGAVVWSATATTTVEMYDPATDTWSTKSPMPGPRYRLAAVTGPDGKIYAIGGSNGPNLVNKVEAYDPITDTWSSAPYLPSPRWDLAAAVGPNSTIYAIGGYSYTPYGRTNTVLAYSPVRIVSIDIKPGSYPNSIYLGSQGNVPVSIFSTLDFDATNINPTTITLAGASVKLKGKGTPMASFEDINEDGILDIVVHVDTTTLELSSGDTDAVLEGETFDGVRIRGTDSVRIVNY
jgi:N-acetylneuraminic acid mutarotase